MELFGAVVSQQSLADGLVSRSWARADLLGVSKQYGLQGSGEISRGFTQWDSFFPVPGQSLLSPGFSSWLWWAGHFIHLPVCG